MFDVVNAKSSLVDFDLKTGLSRARQPLRRALSQMKTIFHDRAAVEGFLRASDPLIHEFFDMGVPETSGDVAYRTSITYPGKVGAEYCMTKGHFHTVIDTAEVYFCLRGHGFMLMESPRAMSRLRSSHRDRPCTYRGAMPTAASTSRRPSPS